MTERTTDLRQDLMNISNPHEFVAAIWETTAKNPAAHSYIIGIIDGLRWGHSISQTDYRALYQKYAFGLSDASPCSSESS